MFSNGKRNSLRREIYVSTFIFALVSISQPYFFLGGFFISVSLQPSGKTILDFPNERNFHFLKPVSNYKEDYDDADDDDDDDDDDDEKETVYVTLT